jgi:Ca2+-binding EF-hand superfamily protein
VFSSTEVPDMNHPTGHHLCRLTMVCGLTLASGVFAESFPNEHAGEAHFKAMDTNDDGTLSADEHAVGAKKMFDTMDANKDGTVTPEEMDAAHEKIAGKKATKADMSSAEKIKMVDSNGDGVLSADEHVAGAKKLFDKMDTNKDGFLSKDELEAGHATILKKNIE